MQIQKLGVTLVQKNISGVSWHGKINVKILIKACGWTPTFFISSVLSLNMTKFNNSDARSSIIIIYDTSDMTVEIVYYSSTVISVRIETPHGVLDMV